MFGSEIDRHGRVGVLPRIALAARVVDPKIVLCVLIKILDGDPIAGRRRLPCQGNIAFEDLLGCATHPDIRAVAVKCLIGLRTSWLLSERSWVKAATRPLIGS